MRTDQALMFVQVPDDMSVMITVWTTTLPGTEIILPFTVAGTYDCVVDWGDGTITEGETWDGAWARHTYADAGTYTVRIVGLMTHWSFNGGGSKDYLVEVPQLGDMGWTNLMGAFYGCSNLGDVRGGEVSQVTDMSYMFTETPLATPDTRAWDTSNVTTMRRMFMDAWSANPDTSNWNTENVADMLGMFQRAYVATPNTSNWDTSKVTTFAAMFYEAVLANPDTSNWNTAACESTYFMFAQAYVANPDVSNWDVSSVTNMSFMFYDARLANPDVSNWDTGNVTSMTSMFAQAYVATPDVSNWNTSKVTNMQGMFNRAFLANPNVTNWDMSSVTTIQQMFYLAESANPDTSLWVVPALTRCDLAFYGCAAMTNAVSSIIFWDNVNITDYEDCFKNSENISNYLDIPEPWGGGAVGFRVGITTTAPSQQFKVQVNDAVDLVVAWGDGTETTYNGNQLAAKTYASVGNYNVTFYGSASRVAFGVTGCTPTLVKSVQTPLSRVAGITNCEDMFNGCTQLVTVSSDFLTDASVNIANMKAMFKNTTLVEIPVSTWDTSNVLTMEAMFEGSAVTIADVSGWDTGSVTNMSSMFKSAQLNPTVTSWDVSNVINFNEMFHNAINATPNVAAWNVVSATSMISMFNGCPANPDVSLWNVSNVVNMGYMFFENTVANPDVSNWNVGSLINAERMFKSATSANPDISLWIAPVLSTVTEMFYGATSLARTMDSTKFWENAVIIAYTDCFKYAVNVVNYEDIPVPWGGPLPDFEANILLTSSLTFSIFADAPTDLVVDWGDGTIDTYNSALSNVQYTHTYASTGAYTIKMHGGATRLGFGSPTSGPNGAKLQSVDKTLEGILGLTSCAWMFRGCTAITTLPADMLTGLYNNITSMAGMFYDARAINPDVSAWDVSTVEDMSYMFINAYIAQPITTAWNTSNVTNMAHMFSNALLANPNVATWDVSKVTAMTSMFNGATGANPVVTAWNTGNVIDMSFMFSNTNAANPDVGNWDVSKVQNFQSMFNNAVAAQPDVSTWVTSSATNMAAMFASMNANPNVAGWNVSSVANMSYMFYNNILANPDVSSWNVSSVTNMDSMFFGAEIATPNTAAWDTSNVTNMRYMFRGALLANPNTAGWSTNLVTSMQGMFQGAGLANPDVSSWNVNAVTNMSYMFYNATSFAATVNSAQFWENAGVGGNSHINCFTGASSIVNRSEIPLGWGGDKAFTMEVVIPAGTNQKFAIFATNYGLTIDWGDNSGVGVWYTDNVQWPATPDYTVLHSYDVPGTYTVRIDGYAGRFAFWTEYSGGAYQYERNLTRILTDIAGNIIGLTNAKEMFRGCTGITEICEGFFDFSSYTGLTSIEGMFRDTDFAFDGIGLGVSTITNMSYAFYQARGANPDVSAWNVSSVTNMSYMFADCDADPDVTRWDVSSVTDLSYMFYLNTTANPTVTQWLTCSATNLSHMFDGATSANPDISDWVTSTFTNVSYLFKDAVGLARVIPPHLLWTRSSAIGTYTQCFTGATNVVNRNDIPSTWGGSKSGWEITAYAPDDDSNFYIDTTSAVNLVIDWGDGTSNTYNGTAMRSHVYATGATSYTVKISGQASRIAFYNGSPTAPVAYITSINNALKNGVSGVTSCADMFRSCANLASIYEYFLDSYTGITNMSDMFNGASLADPEPKRWITAAVTNMTNMFKNAAACDATIYGTQFWNNAVVASYTDCFTGASSISNRDWIPTAWGGDYVVPTNFDIVVVIPAESKSYKFYTDRPNITVNWGDGLNNNYSSSNLNHECDHTYASAGTYTIQISGTTERVAFNYVGHETKLTAVNSQLNKLSGITSCENMFRGCSNLTELPSGFLDGISISIINMAYMFYGTTVDVLLDHWITTNVTRMNHMFSNNNMDPDIKTWNTGKVIYMTSMFEANTVADPFFGNLNMTGCSYMANMMKGCTGALCIAPGKKFWKQAHGDYTDCFDGAINLKNYATIPTAWK